MTTTLIRLTEITKDGDSTKTQPMLLNPDFIASVTTGKLKKAEQSGLHIIGKTQEVAMTFIQFKNGQGTFVEETLEDIQKLVHSVSAAFTTVTTNGK